MSLRRPNKPLELTPLRGPKIAAILKSRIGSNAISIYSGGAAQWQGVGPPSMPNLSIAMDCKPAYDYNLGI
jgi:hypothetical protein